MSGKITNVLFAGLGGQGIIRASDMLTQAAFRMGFDVKKSELHGMSQRGGSVSSDVRFGDKVWSPMIPASSADYLLVTSEDQIEVCRPMLSGDVVIVKPSDLSEEDAASRMMNVALLGLLNKHLKFPAEIWNALIEESFPGQIGEQNKAAFARGAAR